MPVFPSLPLESRTESPARRRKNFLTKTVDWAGSAAARRLIQSKTLALLEKEGKQGKHAMHRMDSIDLCDMNRRPCF